MVTRHVPQIHSVSTSVTGLSVDVMLDTVWQMANVFKIVAKTRYGINKFCFYTVKFIVIFIVLIEPEK